MKKSSIWRLISKFGKIYFSKNSNKDTLYKKELFYTLKDMGGVYNKFLQILCVTKNFMAGWSSPKEFLVYNKAEKEDIDLLDWIPNKAQYQYILEEPIATGSFAQVYKGFLKNGQVVALKVLKPSVYKNLEKDLKRLKIIVRLCSRFINIDILDINAAFNEFCDICLRETDYEREISSMKYFAEMYEDNQFVKVPKVYTSLSNNYLIVQEYIDGVTLADIITGLNPGENIEEKCLRLTGSNIWKQLIIVGGELIRCATEENFLYGDPHSGNIILMPNNKVAFVDFGIVSQAPASKRAFYDWVMTYYNILSGKANVMELLTSTLNCFCPDYINALEKYTNYTFINALANSAEKKMEALKKVNPNIQELIKDGHIFILFREFIDNKNLFGFSVDMRNFQLLKAIQAFICTIYTLDTRFSCDNFSFLMMGAMEYALKSIKKVPYDYDTKSRYSATDTFELLDLIMTNVANNDEFLFNNIYKEMF